MSDVCRIDPFVLLLSGSGELQPDLQGVGLQTSAGGQDRGHLHHAGKRNVLLLISVNNPRVLSDPLTPAGPIRT